MVSKNNSDFVVRYTNKDIMEKLDLIHEETRRTNGRVTKLEADLQSLNKRSLGSWIARNPFKFTIYVGVFFVIVISDFRSPLITLLTSFL